MLTQKIGFWSKIWRKSGFFLSFRIFIRKNGHFRHIFENSQKLIKYTCFRKSRKMAILRGSKLENYWSDWNEILTDKNIRRDLFNAGLRPKKYWIAAELWASQNRDFSKISKTRVFHQLSRIFENMAEIGIFPYKKIFLDFLERKNPHFCHNFEKNPNFWLRDSKKFQKMPFQMLVFSAHLEPYLRLWDDFLGFWSNLC